MTVSTFDPTLTLADLVAENPARAVVLDRIGLDFCCHGQRTVADACAAAGLNPDEVRAHLESVADPAPSQWSGRGRGDLAEYVESTHHAYLHSELPAVERLAVKVRAVHGSRHPELAEVQRLVSALVAALSPHLAAEETDVFPAIAALEPGAAGDAGLRQRISVLVDEHEAVGAQLARLRELTGGYEVPDDGCASYRSLYERLAHLEADTHIHIHLENNVLFPAAMVEAV